MAFASRRVGEVFGYLPDELIGQPVELLLPERLRRAHVGPREAYAYAPVARTMGAAMALLGRHRDGTEFPVEVSLSPLQTAQGTLIISTIRDISKRRQIEDALAREREMLKGVIRAAPAIVLLLDAQGRIEQVNPYLETLCGYPAAELLGRDWFDTLLPEAEREDIREVFRETMNRGFNSGHTNPICARDGSLHHIKWHANTVKDQEGKVICLLNIGYDVTRQLADEREVELSLQEAERGNATKSRFLAAASHDLRQPLQSLGLYLSVLTRLLEDPKPLDVCGKMRKSLDTMAELLDALLDISRLDSGSVVAVLKDVPIDVLLDRIVTDNVQQAEEKGLRLEWQSTGCVVHSDPGLLERVIENLVTNAIRYTDQGAVSITCQPVNGRARISVTDTGIGIPEEALEQIFEEYYQLGNPARDQRKGLGLGLSIVRHIARLLDLELSVTSTVGKGSAFTVGVALGEQQDKQARPPISAPRPADRQPVVLLVENDEAVMDATTMLLESAGMRVHWACDGPAALDQISNGLRPDLLLSDYRLAGMNGVDVVRRVRRALSTPLPAVLMTGDTSSLVIDSGELPNCRVFHKPVDTYRLLAHIDVSLGTGAQRSSA
jgi:two-component system, sensor histidine kinase